MPIKQKAIRTLSEAQERGRQMDELQKAAKKVSVCREALRSAEAEVKRLKEEFGPEVVKMVDLLNR